jgi:3-methyladenine DNA glycosylase AlkD
MRHPTRDRVSAALRRMARPAGSFDAATYFRGTPELRFYNVGAPRVRSLARAVYLANRVDWTIDDAMRFAGELLRDSHLEVKSTGIELLARYRTSFAPGLLPAWKRWLAANLAANWATTDLLCGRLIGPLLADHERLIPLMLSWSAHRNLWVRRASAVALLPAIRRGLALDVAYDVATALQSDGEDLIQKAVGWMLREAGKQDAPRLERYLRSEGARIPRTTVRYAIERFPDAKRRALLEATKGGSRATASGPTTSRGCRSPSAGRSGSARCR